MEGFCLIKGTMNVFICLLCYIITHTYGQTLYSSTIHWMPTGVANEIQFSYHMSWKQLSISCTTPVCLKAYTVSNISVQLLGRWTGYTWSCRQGCTRSGVISNLSKLMFSEVSSYHGNKWEAGEETIKHTFSTKDNVNVEIGFGFTNSSVSTVLGVGNVNLATRNDTKRVNVSPSVAVMPLYSVPLGCSIEIDLFPFDGDGDVIICRWAGTGNTLLKASLNETACRVTVCATVANGYSSNQQYTGSLYVEDYSLTPVHMLYRLTTVSRGPVSRSPVTFTVHVDPSPADIKECERKPSFVQAINATSPLVRSVKPPFSNFNVSFLSTMENVTAVSMGPQGMLFTNITTPEGSGKTGTWSVSDARATAIVRACVMFYSQYGVPGEKHCETILIGDTNECEPVNPCTASARGKCTNVWQHYTCIYPNISTQEAADTTTSYGLMIGLPCGLFVTLVTIVTGSVIYLRKLWTSTHKVDAAK